ncbi:MAG: hypothetical protein ACR2OV_15020 [Hyphomicrobiaceae bacterium]
MWALLVQSALLLLVAYFIGVWVGCMLRSSFAPRTAISTAMETAGKVGVAAVPANAVAAGDKLEQPLTPIEVQAEPAADVPTETVATDPVPTETSAVDIVEAEQPMTVSPLAAQSQSPESSSEPDRQPAHEPEASEVATAYIEPVLEERLPSATGSSGTAAVAARIDNKSEFQSRETVVQLPPKAAPDDLLDIRGIDNPTADLLAGAGVARFEQIAAWNEGDVARINRLLGGERRVQNENWIEQAKILADGSTTAFARSRQGAGDLIVEPAIEQPSVIAAPEPAPIESPLPAKPALVVEETPDDDLTRIRGIDADAEARLRSAMGVRTFGDIANWSMEEVSAANGLMASERQVQGENWIEQAQILASGRQSTYARLGGDSISMAVPTGDQGEPVCLPVTTPPDATTPVAAEAPVASTDPTVVTDDGRGLIDKTLHDAGSGEDAAVATNTDMAQLRSVKSEAYRPIKQEAARSSHDDLKRIRGVGTLIERNLNSMGYTTYADVANWSRNEVDRISQKLDFHGRIERENWIEQARILASGGQTEFSRRIDRGEA